MTNPSKILPVLSAVLLCDTAANDPSSHKKSLIGIFDRLWAGGFPTKRPIAIYVRLTDAEGDYQMKIRLCRTSDGTALQEIGVGFTIGNRLVSSDFIVPPVEYMFDEPGKYEFQIWTNGVLLGFAPIVVENFPPARSGGNG